MATDWIVLVGAPLVVCYVIYVYVFEPDPTQDSHRERWQELAEGTRFDTKSAPSGDTDG